MDRISAFVLRERQFTRDASHELRSPLTVIRGAAEILSSRISPEDPKSMDVLDRIRRAVATMEDTVSCFLWLAREANEAASDPAERIDVARVVEKEVSQHRHLLRAKPVSVMFESKSRPEMAGPAHIFSIAVSNLIRNAFHFTSQGSVHITVWDEKVVVSDTGCGLGEMAPDDAIIPHKMGAQSTGFGLGLAIVQRICDRFGWRLIIDSDGETGTTVTLIFSQADSESL